MDLQGKYDLTHGMNESLTGEILCNGLHYVESITQEGHGAPWDRHAGSSGGWLHQHFRGSWMQHNAPWLGPSPPVSQRGSLLSILLISAQRSFPQGMSFSNPSASPFPYSKPTGSDPPMKWSYTLKFSFKYRHHSMFSCKDTRLLSSLFTRPWTPRRQEPCLFHSPL